MDETLAQEYEQSSSGFSHEKPPDDELLEAIISVPEARYRAVMNEARAQEARRQEREIVVFRETGLARAWSEAVISFCKKNGLRPPQVHHLRGCKDAWAGNIHYRDVPIFSWYSEILEEYPRRKYPEYIIRVFSTQCPWHHYISHVSGSEAEGVEEYVQVFAQEQLPDGTLGYGPIRPDGRSFDPVITRQLNRHIHIILPPTLVGSEVR